MHLAIGTGAHYSAHLTGLALRRILEDLHARGVKRGGEERLGDHARLVGKCGHSGKCGRARVRHLRSGVLRPPAWVANAVALGGDLRTRHGGARARECTMHVRAAHVLRLLGGTTARGARQYRRAQVDACRASAWARQPAGSLESIVGVKLH